MLRVRPLGMRMPTTLATGSGAEGKGAPAAVPPLQLEWSGTATTGGSAPGGGAAPPCIAAPAAAAAAYAAAACCGDHPGCGPGCGGVAHAGGGQAQCGGGGEGA